MIYAVSTARVAGEQAVAGCELTLYSSLVCIVIKLFISSVCLIDTVVYASQVGIYQYMQV